MYVKTSKMFPNLSLEQIKLAEYLDDSSTWKSKDEYWENKANQLTATFGVKNAEEAKALYEKIKADPSYSMEDLKKDLRDMVDIVAGRAKEPKSTATLTEPFKKPLEDPYKKIFGIKGTIDKPDTIRGPSEKEWQHEKLRIYNSMNQAPAGGQPWLHGIEAKLIQRMNAIKQPQKMLAFAMALEDNNFHGLAEEAYGQLKAWGYEWLDTGKGKYNNRADLQMTRHPVVHKPLSSAPVLDRIIEAEKKIPKRLIRMTPDDTSWSAKSFVITDPFRKACTVKDTKKRKKRG
jgi:hypothetical protein